MADAEQSDAARRAAARKAKILARGNTGLAKLAQTARGEEADKLYGQDSASASPRSQPSPAPPSSSSQPQHPPSSQRAANPPPQPPMPSDQQAFSDQLSSMMSMFGGAGAPGTDGSPPDIQRLLAQMMGVDPSSSQNLLGDLDDPAGLSGGPPPNPFAGAGGLNGFPSFPGMGMPGMPGMGMPGMGDGGGGRTRSKVEKYFPLVHVLSILGLLAFVVLWWEPRLFGSFGGAAWGVQGIKRGWQGRWADLSGSSILGRGKTQLWVQSLPVFWAFTTLELIIQTTRFTILKSPPPPHSLISTFLPLLPPAIARPLVTGSRYLSLLSQMYKDACLLVFGVGMTVVLAECLNPPII